MKFFKWMFWAGAAFLLQTQFSFSLGRPNITVVLVYYYGLTSVAGLNSRDIRGSRPEIESVAFGALVGLAEDVISGPLLGPSLLSKGLIGFLTPLLFMDVIFRWTPLWAGMIVSLFTVMDGVIVIGAGMVFGDLNVNMTHAVRELAFQVLINILLSMGLRPGEYD